MYILYVNLVFFGKLLVSSKIIANELKLILSASFLHVSEFSKRFGGFRKTSVYREKPERRNTFFAHSALVRRSGFTTELWASAASMKLKPKKNILC